MGLVRMKVGLFLFCLLAVVLCQNDPDEVPSLTGGNGIGGAPFTRSTGCSGFILEYQAGTFGTAEVESGTGVAFDVDNPFAENPSYRIEARWCGGSSTTAPDCTDFAVGPFTDLNGGTADGRCPLRFTSDAPGDNTYSTGNTTVTFTFTNPFNTANFGTCESTVTVTDDERPQVACPVDMTFRPDEGECMLNATFVPPVPIASDNCGAPDTTLVPSLADPFVIGENNYQFTAVDDAGLSSQCSFTYTYEVDYYVDFVTCPVADAARRVTVNNIAGTCVGEVEFIDEAQIENNCTSLDVESTRPIAGFNYTVGNNTQVLSVTGDNGTVSCIYTVEVIDTEQPTIVCPSDLNVTTFGADQFVRIPPPVVDDNCGSRAVSVSADVPNPNRFSVGTTTVTYTADDGYTVPVTCSFDVVVTQLVAPPTPTPRPIEFPTVTPTNTPTRNLPANGDPAMEPPSPSRSNTPTRLPNPSPTRTPSPQISISPSSSRSRTPSPSRSPSPTRTPTPSPYDLNISRSPYVPSASPSPSPIYDVPLF